MSIRPSAVGCSERFVVRLTVFSDSLRHNLLAWKQLPKPLANQVITCGSRGPSVSLYKWVDPIESPQSIRRQQGWLFHGCPVLVDNRKEQVHLVGNILEMGRNMVADVNWFFPVSAAELSNVRNGSIVKGPKRVFIKRFDAFFQCQSQCNWKVGRIDGEGSALES